jgi:hypothetical protein
MCNRDERDTRPAAISPRWRALGARRAILPVDPVGGGTWIGANDLGLVITVLNRTDDPRAVRRRDQCRSRGLLIPSLLEHAALARVLDAVGDMDVSGFEPFRLVAIQHGELASVASDGRSTAIDRVPLRHPLVFASSSLGDRLVEGPRRQLFERMVLRAHDSWLEGQSRFHWHQWPNWPELSVRMERRGARTVSVSAVDVTGVGVDFQYEPLHAVVRAA